MQTLGKSVTPSIYLLVLSGEVSDARTAVEKRFPQHDCIVLIKRELRQSGWRGQIKALVRAKGDAFVFYVRSLNDVKEPQLLVCSTALHRCRQTFVLSSAGESLEYGKWDWLRNFPKVFVSALNDAAILIVGWVILQALRFGARPVDAQSANSQALDLAYLYPYPLDSAVAGGALSHVKGFLSGISECESSCQVFSGRPLPFESPRQTIVPAKRRFFLFRESLMLSYNRPFTRAVRKSLRECQVRSLYQRHGRFTVAGAMLSRNLNIPLILEYNGSEIWTARYWDPARFGSWLRLCEDISLRCASKIVVVSEELKTELESRGIHSQRILVNPNAVDTALFRPGCGGEQIREQLGWSDSDVVAAFVGSFSYWHGIDVLVRAIQEIRKQHCDLDGRRLRFLLVGEGPLYAEARRLLQCEGDRVVFTGIIPHERVPDHLDAADILLSPHVRMPDGQPFFGSPTKIFEYMAMGKAIVASNLEQLARVLEQGSTAWLVEPGNASEFASAIILLARNAELRRHLGNNARRTAIVHHSWRQNAEHVLSFIGPNVARPLRSPVRP